ncbi:M56/M15 family metallopeptidase [uncultured Chitinophaga sp.]|uniref:M56/M15 family metallopeptidase n=1 Tax=uncultured Chitinophaga sp. TaxID=339340 RepID=UPI0025E9E529|nr:M56/M15 family metallopeptidase [uncultured Chitinophaga sp.]
MSVFFQYLVQSSVCLLAFYLLYLAVLRRLTFFSWSRIYLLVALFASAIIPQLTIESSFAAAPVTVIQPLQQVTLTVLPGGFEDELVPAGEAQAPIWPQVVWMVYLAGAMIVAGRLLLAVAGMWRMVRNSERITQDGYRIILTKGINASFAHYIFIDRDAFASDDRTHILLHEQTHVKLRHSADLMLLELVTVICWFNPVIWLYKKSVKEVHEYQVDRIVSGETNAKTYAGILLKLATAGMSLPVHTFSMQPLKGRITMLFTNPSHNMKKLFFLLVIPVAGVLLYSFAMVEKPTAPGTVPANDEPYVIVLDAGHGGHDWGSKGADAYEKDMAMQLTKEIATQAKAAGFEIIYTRSGDEFIDPKGRVEMLKDKKKANLFLSIHTNGAQNATPSGSEIYISNKNQYFSSSVHAAREMQTSLKDLEGIPVTKNPIVREKGIYVLDNAPTTAVMLNIGYVTNPNDVKYLQDEAWRKAFATKVLGVFTRLRMHGIGTATMHDKMGVPEEMTHIWQMDKNNGKPTYKFNKKGELEIQDGC